jgi:hypothetical protein
LPVAITRIDIGPKRRHYSVACRRKGSGRKGRKWPREGNVSIVVNVNGVEEKFLWLYWFDGADDLLADPSFYLNREVYVEYVDLEMFDGISRAYVPVKVLVSILGNE